MSLTIDTESCMWVVINSCLDSIIRWGVSLWSKVVWQRQKVPLCGRHFRMFFHEFKIRVFSLQFCRNVFPTVRLTINSVGSCKGHGPKRSQVIICENGGLVYRRLYASYGLNALYVHLNSKYSRGIRDLVKTSVKIRAWVKNYIPFCCGFIYLFSAQHNMGIHEAKVSFEVT